jgi:hypothetical protein
MILLVFFEYRSFCGLWCLALYAPRRIVSSNHAAEHRCFLGNLVG